MTDRHRFRAQWHDYNDGIYFVTICSHEKRHVFGRISNGEMHFSRLGEIVAQSLESIPIHYPHAEVYNYVVMPNHVHLVISVGTRYIASPQPEVTGKRISSNFGCLKPPKHGEACEDFHHNCSLATIIGSFKAAVTRQANRLEDGGDVSGGRDGLGGRDVSRPYWQQRYYEHIIRDQRAFDNIMKYVDNNVMSWESDCFND